MRPIADELVDEYLKRLSRELRGLPRARRRELLAEIADHVAAARAELPVEDEAAIRTLLDRIGDPEDVAAAARERFGLGEAHAGWREVMAVALLPLGGVIVPFLGWLAGVAFLWGSQVWTRRDKLIGTLLLPGGLALAVWTGVGLIAPAEDGCVFTSFPDGRTTSDCPPDDTTLGEIVVAVLWWASFAIPLVVTGYLAWGLRGRFRHAQR